MPEYVANAGNSCYYCKTELYSTLNKLADDLQQSGDAAGSRQVEPWLCCRAFVAGPPLRVLRLLLTCTARHGTVQVVMFNGTNADDRRDPTRLGLKAAVSAWLPRRHP